MSARVSLGTSSIVLNVIVMLLNIVGLVMGLYLRNTPDVHKYFIAASRYDHIVSLIFVTGILMSLTNFMGIVFCSCALMTSGRSGCGSWIAMQMIFLFLFAWLLLATGILLLMETTGLELKLSIGFNKSIRDYNSSTETKERIDRLQLEYECCGFDNMSNWLTTPWVNESLVTNPRRTLIAPGSHFVVNAVPFSCCNTSAKTPCAHFPLPTFLEPTIYKTGCAVAVASSIRFRLCWFFGIGNIVVFVITLLLCVLVRSFSLADGADREKAERLALREEKRALRQGRKPLGQGRQVLVQGRQAFDQGRQSFGQGKQALGQGKQALIQGRQPFRQTKPLLEPEFEEDDFFEEEDEFEEDFDDRRRPRRTRSRHSHRRRKHRSHRPRRRHRSKRGRRRYSSY